MPGSDDSPLDDLFVGGAKYHEPSAADRAKAAREAEQRAQREQKERKKRVAHTRRVLQGGGATYDKRVAWISLGVMLALAVVLSQTGFWR